MQHPDEGTIHAWLDGALPAEQARALEEHLAACASCEANAAEARGMVAGASRILAALDGVPAGVVPKGAGTRRAQPRRTAWFRRPGVGIAAAMAVVAVGTTWAVTRDWDQAAFQRAELASEITLRAPVSDPERQPSPAAPLPVVVTADSAAADPRQGEGVAPSRTRPAAGMAANAESAQSIVVQESSGIPAPRAADVSRLLSERQEQVRIAIPSESSVEAAKAVQNDAAARGQVGAVDSAARVEMLCSIPSEELSSSF